MKNYTIVILNKETINIQNSKKLEIMNGELGPAIKRVLSPTKTEYIPVANITSMIVEDLDKKSSIEKKRQKHVKKIEGKK